MPIRLTIAYAERLVKERFDAGSQTRKDICFICQFWYKLSKIDIADNAHTADTLAQLFEATRSAANRLLHDNGLIIASPALKLHEKFELSLLSAVMWSCVEALAGILKAVGVEGEPCERQNGPLIDAAERNKWLQEKVDRITNLHIDFLIGTSPKPYVASFFEEARSFVSAVFYESELGPFKAQVSLKLPDTSKHLFGVWISSDSPSGKWLTNYLNFIHQNEWSGRVPVDVKSVQQALQHFLQSSADTVNKRANEWARYRQWLIELPDHKETMFNEKFGVRKVFVQPLARYNVAGTNRKTGVIIHDVANLIATLISKRVPSDDLILLCGGPGSGKSTLCRIIASELALNNEIHPIFLKLRRLQDAQEISNFIETYLQREGIIDKLSDLADVPNLVLILDGFDELVMATRSRLREFFNTLREDLGSGPLRNAKAIVSGRDTLFPNGAGLPIGSHVVSVLPFDKTRISVWGEKWRSLHSNSPERDFRPEIFYDERQTKTPMKAKPLHHLVSWPLTLHLVARAHSGGALVTEGLEQDAVEKGVLFRSIVSQTALRQQQQSAGGGRLSPEQMREFVQAIAWEMYSTSRDALDYSEGLPLLKSVFPARTEIELADLADVAIVNQPELTKGEEGGFEFVHKSFGEYFVAEKFAHTLEKIAFKSQDYDSSTPTWRMSVKEATGELSSLFGLRVVPQEVQEMAEPMLADFKEFTRSSESERPCIASLVEKLRTKKVRLEELLASYISGNHQHDVVEPVRGSKIVRNEREIHANFSLGLLAFGCTITKRMNTLHAKNNEPEERLLIEDHKLWRLISIIQSAEIQIDERLAERCLSPLTVSLDKEPVIVSYPPLPPRLLRGVEGMVFEVERSVHAVIELAAVLSTENLFLALLEMTRERDFKPALYQSRVQLKRIMEFEEGFVQIGMRPVSWQRGNRHYIPKLEKQLYRLGKYLRNFDKLPEHLELMRNIIRDRLGAKNGTALELLEQIESLNDKIRQTNLSD